MKTVYYNFAGNPVRLLIDDGAIPESCEIFDRECGSLIRRDELALDVMSSHQSLLISEGDFETLLKRVTAE